MGFLGVSDAVFSVAVPLADPPLAAAIAYAAPWPRARGRAARARLLAVSASFAAFFGRPLLAWTGVADVPWWPLAEKLLGIAAALVVLLFLHPPARLRAWLGA